MTQNTSLEIIIPQAALRYFYQDDDATFEIEDKIRAKNIATFPKSFFFEKTSDSPKLTIKFKFVRSWNFKRYYASDVLDKIESDARGVYSFYAETDEEIKNTHGINMDRQLLLLLEMQPKIQIILLAIQIAIPGFVDFNRDWVTTNSKDKTLNHLAPKIFHSMISDLSQTYRFNKYDFKWPKLDDIKVKNVFNWILPKLLKPYSESKIERTLFAFTLIHNSDSWKYDLTTQLFYSMMGIEALYCDSSANILDQLRSRIKLVLGEHEEYKNRLTKMYSFRSNYIHGSQNMPNIISLNNLDLMPRKNDFDKINQSAQLAAAILLSSIQYLILNQKEDLNFHTVVE